MIFKTTEESKEIYNLLKELSGDNPELIREYLRNMEEIYAEHLKEERIIYEIKLEEKNRIYEKALREEKGITPAEEIWKEEELEQLEFNITCQILRKNPYKRFLLRDFYDFKIYYSEAGAYSELKSRYDKEDIRIVLNRMVEKDILQQDDNSFYHMTEKAFDDFFD